MTTLRAIEYINYFISNIVGEYSSTDANVADLSADIYALNSKTNIDKLLSLDYAIKSIALNTIPISLLESFGSTATEFKKISTQEYIRLPSIPTLDGDLDIDEALSFAVIYKALSFIWSGFSIYASDADAICASHNDITRDYLMSRDSVIIDQKTVYFRYSTDGLNFHDNFIEGDTFISFKQGDGVWGGAIKFVGGAGDGTVTAEATKFTELTDTPSMLTVGKYLVSGENNTVIEADDPTTPEGMVGADGVSGYLALDMRHGNGNTISSYYVLAGDLSINFSETNGVYDLDAGVIYTMEIFPSGFTCTLGFIAKGNKIIEPTSYANIIQFMYDGLDIFILQNISYAN